MTIDNSHKNLSSASLKGQDFSYVSFAHSDLRGADLTGSDLTGADFSHCKTGIPTSKTILILLVALIISAASGYLAMLAGSTIHGMIRSHSENIRIAGIISLVTIIMFIAISMWKGVGRAITTLILPVSFVAVLIGLVVVITGAGSGEGVLYLIISLLLVVVMFLIGTIARAAAGSLSNVLFMAVALTGGVFGRNVGGGIGTVIMALSCAYISKRALKGHPGFESLTKVAFYIIQRFGTSFRNTNLNSSHFEGTTIHCSDFSGAQTTYVNWADSRKRNCLMNGKLMSDKKASRSESLNNTTMSNNV